MNVDEFTMTGVPSESVSAGVERPEYRHASRPEMVALVPPTARRILDVGCNTGAFCEALKCVLPDIETWGLEPDPGAANRARDRMDHVVVGLFDRQIGLPVAHFDVLVFNDVLEHMVDPWSALNFARELLAPGGLVLVSLPNIRHQENLLHLLRDEDFRYESEGIRDRTHVRFFTKKSALRMFEQCHYDVERAEGISEEWWTPSIVRRLAYRIFSRRLEDTKFIQFAFVVRPRPV